MDEPTPALRAVDGIINTIKGNLTYKMSTKGEIVGKVTDDLRVLYPRIDFECFSLKFNIFGPPEDRMVTVIYMAEEQEVM